MKAVGVAGPSGSGKSVLSTGLARHIPGCGVLCTDSYYRDLSDRTPEEREAVNYDAPDALDWQLLLTHFPKLRNGETVSVPRYEFSTHGRLAVTDLCGPWSVVVLEGIFALWHPEVRATLDLAVFVDTPEHECLRRRIVRDTTTRGRTEASVRERWSRDVAPMYRKHALPTRSRADLVVDGRRPTDEMVRCVLATLP